MHEPLTHPKLIRDVLCRAIAQFNATDAKALLKPGNGSGGPNEPAIGTQLITRIVDALRHYDVPEYVFAIGTYNRFGDDRKFLYKMEAYRKEIEAAKRELDPEGKLAIFPDIIVHEFGAPGPNYLVVELKKDSNAGKALVELDHIKLSCMTSPDRPLKYILGAEVRAHDVANEQKRQLEVLSWWQQGSKVGEP
ncbi:hypothetical protein [Opitutus terrae]|uniref:Uncharacterized protein n=1 Tax=Opitutus terrae (strain DSM 11246 / JCM 15787 / PB90-1) TaxID=452637 RepID=B1ZRI4_OPITP|nr:hypothetical protein [Opitutus terrae]ACB77634.1 hypothetical protein Oter_4363 [Opitutus terrae PB90-1]